MKVSELIEKLKALPPEREVRYIWDGSAFSKVDHAWLAKGGDVMLCEQMEVVYDDDDRPVDAPTQSENSNWETPKIRKTDIEIFDESMGI